MIKLKQKGISIVEVTVVIAILGIILAVAIPGFSKIKKAQILKTSTQDVFSVLNKARSETLASLDSSNYGVHFQSDKVVLFKGTSYSANDANNENINIMSPAALSVSPGGNTNVYFSKLTGTPNPAGTTTVTVSISSANLSKIITILGTGAISVN